MQAKTLALGLFFVVIGLTLSSCQDTRKDNRYMGSGSNFIDPLTADAVAAPLPVTQSTDVEIDFPNLPEAQPLPVSEQTKTDAGKTEPEMPKTEPTSPPIVTTPPAPTTPPVKEPAAPLMRNYKERYVAGQAGFGFKYDLKCEGDELISGVRFDDRGDDHVLGIYCAKFDASASFLREQLVATENRAGNLISIECPSNGYLGGLFMDALFDRGEDGLYCRQSPAYQLNLQEVKPVRSGDGDVYDSFCALGNFVTGALYQDVLDDSIHSIMCSKLIPVR